MRGFVGRFPARGRARRGVHVRGGAPVLLLGVVLMGCGSTATPRDSGALPAAGWVQRGVSLFRSASSVLVLPRADGETFCGYVQPSCNAYTITQTPAATPGIARSCDSIPSCATTFFTPMVNRLDFGDGAPSGVEVTGDTTGCQGWCVWRMDFDRSSGVIVAVDIYLRGGTHQGWPTWEFRSYVINGSALATPTPAPTFPPHSSKSSASTPSP